MDNNNNKPGNVLKREEYEILALKKMTYQWSKLINPLLLRAHEIGHWWVLYHRTFYVGVGSVSETSFQARDHAA